MFGTLAWREASDRSRAGRRPAAPGSPPPPAVPARTRFPPKAGRGAEAVWASVADPGPRRPGSPPGRRRVTVTRSGRLAPPRAVAHGPAHHPPGRRTGRDRHPLRQYRPGGRGGCNQTPAPTVRVGRSAVPDPRPVRPRHPRHDRAAGGGGGFPDPRPGSRASSISDRRQRAGPYPAAGPVSRGNPAESRPGGRPGVENPSTRPADTAPLSGPPGVAIRPRPAGVR